MTREELFESYRGEAEYYEKASITEEVILPVTRSGFESLVLSAAKSVGLPVDDTSRSVCAGYIHHIDNGKDSITIEELGKVLWKSMANFSSWTIDQEIKAKRKTEAQAKLTVVEPEPA